MKSRAAIVVSHGQPSEPDVAEQEIVELAGKVGELLDDWSVYGASLAGPQTLEAALQRCQSAETTVIYPLFMSDGWFTNTVLPKRLAGAQVTQLAPLGLDSALVDLGVQAVTDRLGPDPNLTTLIVAGHGSGKSKRPAEITQQFASALEARLAPNHAINVTCAFVEQEPYLAEVFRRAGSSSLCLPFFAARRGHVLEDLPQAAAEADYPGPILDPIGCHPGVPQLIANAIAAEISGPSAPRDQPNR